MIAELPRPFAQALLLIPRPGRAGDRFIWSHLDVAVEGEEFVILRKEAHDEIRKRLNGTALTPMIPDAPEEPSDG